MEQKQEVRVHIPVSDIQSLRQTQGTSNSYGALTRTIRDAVSEYLQKRGMS